MNKDPKYITCGTHEKRRWSIVCVHLCDAKSKRWIPIPQSEDDSAFNDWVCPKCYMDWNRMMDAGDISFMKAVCVECVKALRFLYDKNYKDISPEQAATNQTNKKG